MAVENLTLRFLPRSLQVNIKMKMNSSNMPSKSGKEEEAAPCHTESNDQKKKKRKRRDTHAAIEEDSTSIKHAKTGEKKKKKKNKDATVLHEPNGHPIGSFELEDIIAGFLSSRGLHSTLSVFVSETQHEYTKRAHTVQLEDIYHYYLNRIYENPMEQKAEEVKFKETNFCKNVDTEFNDEDAKMKKNKATFRGNGDAEIISSSGSDKGAIEKDLYRSDKNKEFATEAMDNFNGQAHKRKTGKAENNSEIVAGTCKGEIKLSKAPNESEQVLEFDESVCELQKNKGKKKKVALEERTLTDNEEQISSKKNKKVKIMPENKLQSTESCTSHRKAANEIIAPLTNIPDRYEPKKNKKLKLHDMSPRDHEQLIIGKKNKKGKMTGNSQSTESHATNKESKEEGLGNLSKDTRKLQDFEVKEENKKKSTEITLKDHSKITIHKKNMKEKKDFEKLQACSNAGNGAKEIREYVFEGNDSTQNISQAHMAIEANKSITSESVVSKNDSTVPAYKNRDAPGEQGGDKDTKANVSPDLKDSQRKLETPKTEKSFQRVKVKEVYFSDPRLRDNSYWGKDGAENGYGARAQEVLGRVKGKDFQHEKTKKKRGSYTGGMIDLQSHSIKFSYSDEE